VIAADVLTVERYRADRDAAAWDAFIGQSRIAHFLFRRAYMDYHADRFGDASLVIRRGEQVLGVLPASRDGSTVVSHGGLTFGGLQTDDRSGASAVHEMLERSLDHLARDGVERLVYKAVPHIYQRTPADEDLYAIWRLGAVMSRRDIAASIRLDPAPRYSKVRRYTVRRARASGLVVQRSDDWDAFMAIERATLARHGVEPVHTAAELRMLAARFPDEITLTAATQDGEMVAGVVLYTTPRVAHAQYIGATSEGRDLGATDAVIDSLVEGEAVAGRAFFDFGISTVDAGRTLNGGLAAYKEGFGARGVVYDSYTVDLT
jgi:Acetyltransferase (GNAT) domain